LRSTFEANGARWVFIVTGPSSSSGSSDYISHYGLDFGFRTNDGDNSSGSRYIANSPLFSGVPWIGVIRVSDMTLYAHDGDWGSFDMGAIAEELAR